MGSRYNPPRRSRPTTRTRGHLPASRSAPRKETAMALPAALAAIAQDLEAVRAEVLREADGLSQAQADWRPAPDDWSVGEILHHLTLAEINTGKLTSKLLKETDGPAAPYPADLVGFASLPQWPPGPREAPPVVRPEK